MVGIVIVAHGELSSCIKETVSLFTKDVANIISVDLKEDSGPEELIQDLERAVYEVDNGKGVLIMADLFGGTPANSAWNIISSNKNCLGITGVNLGMILEILFQRDETKNLYDLLKIAEEAGTNSIKILEPIEQ